MDLPQEAIKRAKRNELIVFLLLTIVAAPIAAVFIVGGYGLSVWLLQLLMAA